jgi:hypothetical protein
MMRARRSYAYLGMLVAGGLAVGGCGYKGAIYSSYQEVGLGIRATAESEAPVKVHFGYDRSVGAFVPRRGGDLKNEESTSLISREEVSADANPANAGKNILSVNSAFISGTAAIVASAPSGATVTLAPAMAKECAPCPEAKEKGTPLGSQSFVTRGAPGRRIGMALTQQPGRLSDLQIDIQGVVKLIDAKPAEERSATYARAANAMPGEFKQLYQAGIDKKLSPADAFKSATDKYLQNQPEENARLEELHDALIGAMKEN